MAGKGKKNQTFYLYQVYEMHYIDSKIRNYPLEYDESLPANDVTLAEYILDQMERHDGDKVACVRKI